ncbi:hypothetical protein PC114_g25528 [Phytophthora cactorum]|nr:hypothetical protein PC114_g25528 [Phytophthora cactorum]
MAGISVNPDTFPEDTEYPDLYKGKYGPTEEVMEKADSPLDLLFFFMPRSLWSKIAKESNRYYDQHLNERIDRMYRKQREKADSNDVVGSDGRPPSRFGRKQSAGVVCDGNKRVYFCDRVRPKHYPGNTLTCHQIWHIKWNNGKDRPRPLVSRDIQMRGLGKKRRHTSESEGEGESCKDGEDDDQAAGE